MSNWLAIAAVTETLAQFLLGAAANAVPGATVTTNRPEVKPVGTAVDPAINLYLYQVTPNAVLRNEDLPTRRPGGDLARRPQVALDLHYMLSFVGNDKQLEPQRLMGATVSALHAHPTLTPDQIRAAIQSVTALDPTHYLAGADLHEQVAQVRFLPAPLNLEELSKIWSIFFQTPYTLSIAYTGSVVLIEADVTPRPGLPVATRQVHGVLLRQPSINTIVNADGMRHPILAGEMLHIRGQRLKADLTRVMIDDITITPGFDSVTDTEVRMALSAPPLPAGWLRAGAHSLCVTHPVMMGGNPPSDPPVEHTGITSNLAVFLLRPTLTIATQNVSCRLEAGAMLCNLDFVLTFDPPVGLEQTVALRLNAFEPAPGQPRHDRELPIAVTAPTPGATETHNLTAHVADLAAGTYFASVVVDAAASPVQEVTFP